MQGPERGRGASAHVTDLTSGSLLARARAGDERAVNALFARYVPMLRRIAHGRLPRWARQLGDTADVVQDSVMGVLGHLSTFEPRREGAFRAYLRQAVMNRIRDRYRMAANQPERLELDSGYESAAPSPLEQTIGAEGARRYAQALTRLTPDEREAVVARLELGYSFEQIAALVRRRTPDAARMMVSRAIAKLARDMANERQRRD